MSSPEFAGGLADAPVRGGAVTLASMVGYDNAIAIAPDSYAYKTFTPINGLSYTLSVIVKMDDGLPPSFGNGAHDGNTNSFILVVAASVVSSPTYTVTQLLDGSYRVSGTAVATTGTHFGVVKYVGNNNRTFKVTGYKLERGSVATPYTPQSILRQRGTYQDSTGTMALSAVGEVLGLLTDRLGTVGPELVTTPSVAGVAIDGTTAVTPYTVGDSMVAGKTYQGTYTVTGYTGSNDVGFASGSFAAVTGATRVTANGTYTFIATAVNPQISLFTRPISNTANFSNVTVKELTGNHATQPTPAQKPTLVRVPKRLGVEMIASQDLTTWTSGGAFGNWAGTTSTATTITTTGTNGGRYVRLPCTPGKTYTFAALVTAGTGQGAVAIAYGTSGNVLISEQTSLFTGAGVARCTTVAPANAVFVEFVVRGGTSGQTVTFASLSAGEVLEWTNAISFDGSNDFIQTGIATGTDGWLCAAITLSTGAPANQSIMYSGADADINAGVWLAISGGSVRFGVGNGTTRNTIFGATVPVGTPVVIEGGWDASLVRCALNGAETTLAKTVNCATSRTMRIGMTEGSWPLGGSGTAFIHCQTVPTEAERDIIRKWMASTNRAPYWGELPTLSLDFVSGDYLISNGEV